MPPDKIIAPVVETTEVTPEEAPADPREAARAAFQKETAELVAKNKKEADEQTERIKASGGSKKPAKDLEAELEAEDKGEKPAAKKEDDKPAGKEESKGKMMLTIDGEEVEHEIEDVKRLAQIAKSSQNREHKATRVAQQAERFVRALKENPEAVLSHKSLGLNLEDLAEKILWNKLQDRLKTPEQKQREADDAGREQERAELAEYRKEKTEREEAQKAERLTGMKERYRAEWSEKFTQALDSGKVPVSDWSLTRMAHYMRAGLKTNSKIQPGDVVDLVERDWIQAQQQILGKLKGKDLIKYLGNDVAEEIRKTQLSAFNERDEDPAPENAREKEPKSPKTYSSVDEMFR